MRRCFSLFLLLAAIWPQNVLAQRAIPDDNLAYPVLINLTDCSSNIATIKASGFFLNTGSVFYLVTARHVLFNESERVQPNQARPLQCRKAELLSYSKNPKEKQQNRIQLDLQSLNEGGKVKAHATRDVAVVQIGVIKLGNAKASTTGALEPLIGVQITQYAPSGLLSVGMDTVKKLSEVLTADDVYVLGYPSAIGIQQSPQVDYNAPLIRKGIIAGINDANKTVVLDCLTFHGNSGGPVLEVTRQGLGATFSVIGVVSQYVPVTETWVNATLNYSYFQIHNSGYSIAEPMDMVLDLIGQ